MNEIEAIKHFKEWLERAEIFREGNGITDKADHVMAMETAIKALEKQIPKKPLEETKFYGNGKCPCCAVTFLDRSTNYCGNCGQALDWSDVK